MRSGSGDKYASFVRYLVESGVPEPVAEFKFHPTRRWRADFAWPEYKVLLEVDGGVWIRGRHNRGSGFIKDMEKKNAAAILKYRILFYTPQQLLSADTVSDVKAALGIS